MSKNFIKKLYILIISILSLVAFNSCSSNDDILQNKYSSILQNTDWEMTKLEVTNKLNTKFKKVDFICPEDISFQIEKANYVNATVEDNDWQEIKDCNSRKRYYGTYKIEKNILTLIGTEYEIVSFTEKKLVLKASLDVYAPIGLAEFTHVLKTYKLIEKRN